MEYNLEDLDLSFFEGRDEEMCECTPPLPSPAFVSLFRQACMEWTRITKDSPSILGLNVECCEKCGKNIMLRALRDMVIQMKVSNINGNFLRNGVGH